MLIKTRGIVFRSIKYSETSLIIDVYTEEKGLQKYIVSGVRSKKARVKASLLQVMSLLDLVAYHRNDRDLHRTREVRAAHVYQHLPFEVPRSAVGMFMAEVARRTIRESEENRPLFEFLYDHFLFLDATTHPIGNVHLHFLLNLSGFLGFLPGGDYSAETPFFDLQEGVFVEAAPPHVYFLDTPEAELVYQLLQVSLPEVHTVAIKKEQRRHLLKQLLDYYRWHIDNLPPIHSHEILQEVLG